MTYTSHADVGGSPDFGRITPEPEDELFHAPWEPRAMGLTVAMGATGAWNLDMARSARETLSDYRLLSYYEIWIAALQNMLEARGMLHGDEVVARRSLYPAPPVPRTLKHAEVSAVLAKGASTERPVQAAALFGTGQKVRTIEVQFGHHTRLPRYARGKQGSIERVQGVHVLPDSNSQGLGEQPQWLYTVVFDGVELWGDGTVPGLKVSIDAFEPYLEAV
jgi:nitrile hydratase